MELLATGSGLCPLKPGSVVANRRTSMGRRFAREKLPGRYPACEKYTVKNSPNSICKIQNC